MVPIQVALCLILFVLVGAQEVSLKTRPHHRVVAVGDLHGDYAQMIRTLVALKVIDPVDHNWIGGNYTSFIQLGDVADRGPHTRAIFDFLIKLENQINAAGGRFTFIIGNHELLAMEDVTDYTHIQDIRSFGGFSNRLAHFGPDGEYGKFVRRGKIVHIEAETVFVHAGIVPETAMSPKLLNELFQKHNNGRDGEELDFKRLFKGPRSVLWYRGYADSENPDTVQMCDDLDGVLDTYGAVRMIAGHNPQISRRVLVACGGFTSASILGSQSIFSARMAEQAAWSCSKKTGNRPGTGSTQSTPI